jgi:uncharacterized protein YggE
MNLRHVRTAVATALVLFAAGTQAQYSVGQPSPQQQTIYVSGSAELKVVPDKVEIAVGVETVGTELRVAKAENDAAIARVIAAAKKNGIDATKIQTDFVSITPRHEEGNQHRPINGYIVRKSMVIESSDLAGFEPLMSAVVDAGANHIHSIRFKTTQLRTHRDEARRMAAKAATEKAELLATALGRKLGPAQTISESNDHWWSSYGSSWNDSWQRGYAANTMQNVSTEGSSGGSEDGTFAPGRISVTASVTVTFALQ